MQKGVKGAYSSGGRLLYISLFLERGALNDLVSKQIGGAYSKGALARVVTVYVHFNGGGVWQIQLAYPQTP